MFKFWNSQQEDPSHPPHDMAGQSWYPSSSLASPSPSRPSTAGGSSSSNYSTPRPSEKPQSHSNVSPSEAAGIIAALKDKSVDELKKLLMDKEAYNSFVLSLDQVKTQNNVRDELRKETLQLARETLEKEPQIMELRNQCQIIRTTELATAQEKFRELRKQQEEMLKRYSPAALLHKLHEAMIKTEEESEALHQQLLDREIELGAFVQKYKKLRASYHRRALTHLAAKTSPIL
ncbi:Vacuolar protein-sorting-associated protein 37 homolog 2-like protein [Drosera capensis]